MEKCDHFELTLKIYYGQLTMLIKEESLLLICLTISSSLLLVEMMEKLEFGRSELEN